MIPARYGPILFGAILSGLMSLLVSGISTFRVTGSGTSFLGDWASSWLAAWPIAFPVVMLAAPLTRKIVRLLTTTT